jgi:hypothetical protein
MRDDHCWALKRDGENVEVVRAPWTIIEGWRGHSFAYMGTYRCVSLDMTPLSAVPCWCVVPVVFRDRPGLAPTNWAACWGRPGGSI